MKLLDKLKNALFEEEYVEVEEKPKKIKEKQKPKPIAKKIVLPKEEDKKEEKVEEAIEEKKDFVFPIVDEDDFVDLTEVKEEDTPEIKNVPEEKEEEFLDVKEEKMPPIYQEEIKPQREEHPPLYTGGRKQEVEIQMHEYGFEKKKDKALFTPSPIISPIYGILDKNYKKEDVVSKKEVRLSSYSSNSKIDLDAVRAKAYGTTDDEIFEEELTSKEEQESNYEEPQQEAEEALLDISDDNTPTVPKVTVGDAEEYFEDLGLEYNIDYKDASKEKATGRRSDLRKEEDIKEDAQVEENLFDLIDSMYEEKEGE